MAHKVLIALDSSAGAWRAVEYVAEAFGHAPGVQVMLLHVLSGLPPAFWDDGHILEEKEKESRQRLVAGWQNEQEKKCGMDRASESPLLFRARIRARPVQPRHCVCPAGEGFRMAGMHEQNSPDGTPGQDHRAQVGPSSGSGGRCPGAHSGQCLQRQLPAPVHESPTDVRRLRRGNGENVLRR